MKMTINIALAVTALSMLMPCTLIRAQGPSAATHPNAAQAQPLQGSWEGFEMGREAEGKCTITITGNLLHFQGSNTNEWYETTFTLPAGTDPKQLHATITRCPRPDDIGQVVRAIFKIEDATLTLAGFEDAAQNPPKTPDGDNIFNIVEETLKVVGPRPTASDGFENKQTFRYVLKKAQPPKKNAERNESEPPNSQLKKVEKL